jgi:hypothetical protein
MKQPNIVQRIYLRAAPVLWKAVQVDRLFFGNEPWEAQLEPSEMLQGRNLVLFGDSQIELWPMRRCFGRLAVRNRGRSGDLAETAIERFQNEVLGLGAKSVLILLGTNDLAKGRYPIQIAADIRKIAELALQKGLRPTLCGVLPVRGVYADLRPSERNLELNQRLEVVAKELGIFYLSFDSKLAAPDGGLSQDCTYDGLHPNLRGYKKMTEAVLEVFYCKSGQWTRSSPEVW